MIEFLVGGPEGGACLRRQAEVAVAVATCSCGCPSIGLDVPAEGDIEVQDDGSGYVALAVFQRKLRGITKVTVHVIDGRLFGRNGQRFIVLAT